MREAEGGGGSITLGSRFCLLERFGGKVGWLVEGNHVGWKAGRRSLAGWKVVGLGMMGVIVGLLLSARDDGMACFSSLLVSTRDVLVRKIPR